MAPEPVPPREVRELRLEGAWLLAVGGVFAALLFGAFELGRWVERWNAPVAASEADPLANVEEETVSASERVNFFDTLSGGVEAEPKREAGKPPSAASPPPPPAAPGPWFVQVFAGRDRAAAEEVLRGLRAKGLPTRFDRQAEGGRDALYKVRVGGFADRAAADEAAGRLKREGHPSAWVTKL